MPAMMAKKTALLVIDPQNHFMSGPNTRHLPKLILGLIENGKFDFVIFTKFVNGRKTGFSKILKWRKCMGGRDTEMVGELKPFSNGKNTFVKDTYSPFKNRRFVRLLKKRRVGVLYIAGTDTDACILATAIDAFDFGLRPIILSKFCASHSGQERHREGLKILAGILGKESIR